MMPSFCNVCIFKAREFGLDPCSGDIMKVAKILHASGWCNNIPATAAMKIKAITDKSNRYNFEDEE